MHSSQRLEEDIRSPRIGVAGGFDLPIVGARKQARASAGAETAEPFLQALIQSSK